MDLSMEQVCVSVCVFKGGGVGGGSPRNSKAKWNLDESVHLGLLLIHSGVQTPQCYSHKELEERGCEEEKERKAPFLLL